MNGLNPENRIHRLLFGGGMDLQYRRLGGYRDIKGAVTCFRQLSTMDCLTVPAGIKNQEMNVTESGRLMAVKFIVTPSSSPQYHRLTA